MTINNAAIIECMLELVNIDEDTPVDEMANVVYCQLKWFKADMAGRGKNEFANRIEELMNTSPNFQARSLDWTDVKKWFSRIYLVLADIFRDGSLDGYGMFTGFSPIVIETTVTMSHYRPAPWYVQTHLKEAVEEIQSMMESDSPCLPLVAYNLKAAERVAVQLNEFLERIKTSGSGMRIHEFFVSMQTLRDHYQDDPVIQSLIPVVKIKYTGES